MTAPRLDVRLDQVEHNARQLVGRLKPQGIRVTAVTKAVLGSPPIARRLLAAGVHGLGDSRIENVATLRAAGITAPITLIRSPMISQADRVVERCEVSCNTELTVVAALSAASLRLGVVHGVVLMVELGDLREGIMPGDLEAFVRSMAGLRGIRLHGIGANLACRSGVVPDAANMAELSRLAELTERWSGIRLAVVSAGNSANLRWALGGHPTGRVDDLRIGESILLGCDPLDRSPIEGLHLDAFSLVAEVIESKAKPTVPWGRLQQAAFGEPPPVADRGRVRQTILAIGRQDTDPDDLLAPPGVRIVASSSDHLIIEADAELAPGDEVAFRPGYAALLRAATSPFVTRVHHLGPADAAHRTPAA